MSAIQTLIDEHARCSLNRFALPRHDTALQAQAELLKLQREMTDLRCELIRAKAEIERLSGKAERAEQRIAGWNAFAETMNGGAR